MKKRCQSGNHFLNRRSQRIGMDHSLPGALTLHMRRNLALMSTGVVLRFALLPLHPP
jgi:hypothetical protein